MPSPVKKGDPIPGLDGGDVADYAHLADDYKEPLFVYPNTDHPSDELEAAYAEREGAASALEAARREREATEVGIADELGRLRNLLRESREREVEARRALRARTLDVLEAEAWSCQCPFNENVARLRAYVKKHKGLPPTAEVSDHDEEEIDEDGAELASWIQGLRDAHEQDPRSLPAHRLAQLSNFGVTFPPTEDDEWHRKYFEFQTYVDKYNSDLLRVQSTNGDVVKTLMSYSTDEYVVELQRWVKAQQGEYAASGFEDRAGRFDMLADAGFTFDVISDDGRWDECVDAISNFRLKFGHVHVPDDSRASIPLAAGDGGGAIALKDAVSRITKAVLRDALSPARLASLKRKKLYPDLGGRVFDSHVRHCKAGREERGDGKRNKRKFVAESVMAKAELVSKRTKEVRGNMDNWIAKLEKLVAYKESGGNVADVQNDVKLRLWTFSIIRKLSINSAALRGRKMELIESHEGLKELLMREESVQAAKVDLDAQRNLDKGDDGAKDEAQLEELKDDEELKEFMESNTV